MANSLKILLIEDNESDAALIERTLVKAGYIIFLKRIESIEELTNSLESETWNIIFSDYHLPLFDAPRALNIFKKYKLDIPFIIISGAVGEEAAVEIIKSGAQDYVMKSNLAKLPLVVKRELAEAAQRNELLQTHKELLASNYALESALKSRDEFLIIASHELKTPLTSLKLRLQLMKREVSSNEKLSRGIDFFISQVDQFTRLIENMLDVARIQSGVIPLDLVPLNLSKIVEEVLYQFNAQFAANNSKVSINISDKIQGNWDRSRLTQVLVNLLSNIIKYAKGSSVYIFAEQNDTQTTLTVHDSGPGIPKSKQPLIFKRFERAGAPVSISGLGLGLYICKQIIEALGGSISLLSEEGEGTSFIIVLPNNVSVDQTPVQLH